MVRPGSETNACAILFILSVIASEPNVYNTFKNWMSRNFLIVNPPYKLLKILPISSVLTELYLYNLYSIHTHHIIGLQLLNLVFITTIHKSFTKAIKVGCLMCQVATENGLFWWTTTLCLPLYRSILWQA